MPLKPWRSIEDHVHIKKNCKPGDHASVDGIVMPSPELVYPKAGKQTLKRYAGSQLVIDHNTITTHSAHLEDFAMLSTTEENKSHEVFATSCGNDAKS